MSARSSSRWLATEPEPDARRRLARGHGTGRVASKLKLKRQLARAPYLPICARHGASPCEHGVVKVVLVWKRFESLTQARSAFSLSCCIYVQADSKGHAIRVGKASQGLTPRYRGGTGWALDAAMHGSGNVVFVAAVESALVDAVESRLIWDHRECLVYNNIGKLREPSDDLRLVHRGDCPTFGI